MIGRSVEQDEVFSSEEVGGGINTAGFWRLKKRDRAGGVAASFLMGEFSDVPSGLTITFWRGGGYGGTLDVPSVPAITFR